MQISQRLLDGGHLVGIRGHGRLVRYLLLGPFERWCVRHGFRARLGYLPQEPHFYEYLTAREALRFVGSCSFKGPKKDVEERIDEMLEMVDLTNKADRHVPQRKENVG
jgi:ABC-type multidrug transport system ATPase subunit